MSAARSEVVVVNRQQWVRRICAVLGPIMGCRSLPHRSQDNPLSVSRQSLGIVYLVRLHSGRGSFIREQPSDLFDDGSGQNDTATGCKSS